MSTAQKTPNFLPWLVWGTGVLFYVVAVMNRTSLGSLGPAAQEHFNIQATVLSSFAVLQLVMYAGMQIPVGMLLDRYGVSIVLVTGGIIMFTGQFVMAITSEVWFAVIARMFVGAGDAFIFISVMRMLPDWFPARRLPILGQLTGQIGWIGQVISLMPLAYVVEQYSWRTGFLGVAAAGLLVSMIGIFVMRDTPGQRTVFERLTGREGSLSRSAERLIEEQGLGLQAMPSTTKAVGVVPISDNSNVFKKIIFLFKIPGVRLAFWVHFTPPFMHTTILLLWGTPFLIGGMGVDPVTASVILTSTVIVSTFGGFIFGKLTARYVSKRAYVVIASIILIAAAWLAVVVWPGTPPLALVVTTIMITVLGGPGSMVAFEIVRSYAPRRMIGIATGAVNMGGFISALIAIFIIGLVLDILGAGSPGSYRIGAFQLAFATVFVIWAIGLWRLFAEIHNTKKWIKKRDV